MPWQCKALASSLAAARWASEFPGEDPQLLAVSNWNHHHIELDTY